MSLPTSRSLVAGSHIWCALAGTPLTLAGSAIRYPGATENVVSSNVKPFMGPSQVDAAWVKLGPVKSGKLKVDYGTPIMVETPAPVMLEPEEIIYPMARGSVEFSSQKVDRFALQALFATAQVLENQTQLSIADGQPGLVGWLRYQVMRHDRSTFMTVEQWVSMKLNGDIDLDSAKLTEVPWVATRMASPLNTSGF